MLAVCNMLQYWALPGVSARMLLHYKVVLAFVLLLIPDCYYGIRQLPARPCLR